MIYTPEMMRTLARQHDEDSDTRAALMQAADKIDHLRNGLEDFAKFGTRHDVTPTIAIGDSQQATGHLYSYIRSMDESVRKRANQFLKGE